MTAGPFWWQIDQMREYLNTLRISFLHRHPDSSSRTIPSITGIEQLLDQLEAESSEIVDLPDPVSEPRNCTTSTTGGDLVTDDQGVIIEANGGIETLLNVPILTLEGKPWEIYIHPQSRNPYNAITERLRRGEMIHAAELYLQPRNRASCQVAVKAKPLVTSAGTVEEIHWLVRGAPERHQVQRLLEAAEERFLTLAESIQDGLTIVEDGAVVYLNEQAALIFGYPREELLKLSPLDLAEAEEVPLLTGILEETRRHQTTPEMLEFWIHQKDGSRRCIHNRFTVLRNGRYSVITTDITRRRAADEENARHAKDLELKNEELHAAVPHLRRLTADLDDQKDRLRAILTAILEEIVILSRDLRVSYLNPLTAAAFQMNTAEVIGAGLPKLGVPGERAVPLLEQAIRVLGEGIVPAERENHRPAPGVHHEPGLRPDRGIEAVLPASRDVSSRVAAEEALALSEQRYHSVVDLAPDAIVIHQQGRFVYMNPAGARLFGVGSADPLIGTEMTVLFHPDDREMVCRRIREMEAGTVKAVPLTEVRVLRPDGVPVTVEITSAAIPYNADRAIHSVLRDITGRKKVEKDLHKAVQELKESNRDLEQFAYVASHDLNEPLRTVLSYIQLLEKRYKPALGPDAAEMIGFIVDGGERMKEMIDDLLDYSRLTKGPAFTTVDCEDLLTTTLAQLGHMITEEQAQVTHDQLPCVSGDAGQLQQVFLNLVTNAIKFHGSALPQVHISAERSTDAWTFAFRDNGVGVPAEAQERIFLMFQRLHTQAECPGTGIGLAICRKVIERHGGGLWVESGEGQGSTFLFTLPAPDLHRDGQIR